MAEFDVEMIKLQIPEIGSTNKNEKIMAYIYAVGNLIRQAQNEEERTKICIIARAKLNDQLRDAVMGCPNDWQNIQNIIVATTISNRRSEEAIIAELTTIERGSLNIDEYYREVKNLMVELIACKTENMNQEQAQEVEEQCRNTSKIQFIEGLGIALSVYVARNDPATLGEAYRMAASREEKMKKDNQVKKIGKAVKEVINSEKSKRCHKCREKGHVRLNCPLKKKYCAFHRTLTHKTSECRIFRQMNERHYRSFQSNKYNHKRMRLQGPRSQKFSYKKR